MNKKVIILCLSMCFCCGNLMAQDAQSRSSYIQAFNDYTSKGQIREGVESAIKAAPLYYKGNNYQEAFDLLRHVDQTISTSRISSDEAAALHYLVSKERLQMYIKMRRNEGARDQLNIMYNLANRSGNENVKNDFLYIKAIYHYTFGQNEKGDAVFKEMADKLTASKEYDKVEEVYKTLIANGRKSNNASMVDQSYSNYLAWKDSTNALKHADEIEALKKQIADNEATIADKDSSLSARSAVIVGICILAGALAAALVIGAIILMRYILLTRKQKNLIKLANDNNALKAKFISNISSQLEPTFQKLDKSIPEVQALLTFSDHIQTLSTLENSSDAVETEETPMLPLCEELMNLIKNKVKPNVNLTVNAPKTAININKEYVSHIITHLLGNAAIYTPKGGNIWLDVKKRSPHTYQIMVSDTGCGIPEEKREDIFKPFLEIRDLTQGDGLGLPICKQMALKMNGDLNIDPQFTKGTRFVLELHV
ncbi:MAG: sensor histidine kinase [Prevotella sp.]|nr:sensor histidine kinase [Prevotella sp.]